MACQVMIEDSSISRTHVQLERKDGQWLLRDLISSYGTHIDEKPILGVHKLTSEQIFRVGKRVEILFLEKTDVIPLLFNEFSKRLNDMVTGESKKKDEDRGFGKWRAHSVA